MAPFGSGNRSTSTNMTETYPYHDIQVYYDRDENEYVASEAGEREGRGDTVREALNDFVDGLDHD